MAELFRFESLASTDLRLVTGLISRARSLAAGFAVSFLGGGTAACGETHIDAHGNDRSAPGDAGPNAVNGVPDETLGGAGAGGAGFAGAGSVPAPGGDNSGAGAGALPGTGGFPGTAGAPPGTGGADGAAPDAALCDERLPRRLVRLSFPQIINTIEGEFGTEWAAQLREEQDIDLWRDSYSGLASPREGSVISDAQWQLTDVIASATGGYVEDNFAEVTGCADDLACARDYVAALAERSFRRPATSEELANITQVFDDAVELGGTAALATNYGVYATLSSPLFLYRTELGLADAPGPLVPLTDYELASAVSFFLTDAPPDEELMASAAAGTLSSEAELSEQIDRLLSGDVARTRLTAAMYGYLEYSRVDTLVIDTNIFPEWNSALARSAQMEGQRFLEQELWNAPLTNLLSGRRSFVDQALATLYGVPFPPPNATLDAAGFASVELPEERSGVLTQSAFLVSRSRPDAPSVVARGFQVNTLFACFEFPPPPESAPLIELEQLQDATAREAALFRAQHADCGSCHAMTDPYGLVLDTFDAVGRYRTEDEQGRPIDPVVLLPPLIGGETVANAGGLAEALVKSGRFARCTAEGFARVALADAHATYDCYADEVTLSPAFVAEPTYAELLRQLALSNVFGTRKLDQE